MQYNTEHWILIHWRCVWELLKNKLLWVTQTITIGQLIPPFWKSCLNSPFLFWFGRKDKRNPKPPFLNSPQHSPPHDLILAFTFVHHMSALSDYFKDLRPRVTKICIHVNVCTKQGLIWMLILKGNIFDVSQINLCVCWDISGVKYFILKYLCLNFLYFAILMKEKSILCDKD